MEALVVRVSRIVAVIGFLFSSLGAEHRTENFHVTAKSKALAQEIAEAAERYRAELAVEWLGHELPRWRDPCPIRANVKSHGLGAGGATSFMFETVSRQYGRPVVPPGAGIFAARPAGRPFGWEMTVQGSRERVLDSVLPHEVTHTIFATHFGRPLPRWADEGACTTVEHDSEKNKQHRMLYEFLTTGRGIAFNRMFAMTEYPADILPLYSQGFSLARFLIAQGGRKKFVKYVGRGLETNDWTAATRQFYEFDSLSELQLTWLDWVRQGSPQVTPAEPEMPQVSAGVGTIARTDPQDAGHRTSSSEKGWYARRSAAARGGQIQKSSPVAGSQPVAEAVTPQARRVPAQAASRDVVEVPRPQYLRTSSRPEPSQRQREVLIEWGKPRPILAPSLARQSP